MPADKSALRRHGGMVHVYRRLLRPSTALLRVPSVEKYFDLLVLIGIELGLELELERRVFFFWGGGVELWLSGMRRTIMVNEFRFPCFRLYSTLAGSDNAQAFVCAADGYDCQVQWDGRPRYGSHCRL